MKNKTTLRPSPTALLNPRCDVTFKTMFTQDTKESNAALKDFISTILGREIKEIKLNPNEPPVDMLGEMQMSFDVNVFFDDGERACIEMQSRRQNYDYATRAEIQVARLLNVNTKKGSYWNTDAVYQISVLDFEFDKSDKSVLGWYTMRKENGKQLSKKLNVIFFDLIKIHKLLGTPIEKLSKIEKWGLFLSYADDERYVNYIESLSESEEGLMNAKTSLKYMSQDDINWHRQNSIDIARRDYNSNMKYAIETGLKKGIHKGLKKGYRQGIVQGRQKGLEEGIKEGIKEGKKEGLEEGITQGIEQGSMKMQLDNAKRLLLMNVLSVEQVAEGTGLSIEKVQEVQKSLEKTI